jgi:hypothetical protein
LPTGPEILKKKIQKMKEISCKKNRSPNSVTRNGKKFRIFFFFGREEGGGGGGNKRRRDLRNWKKNNLDLRISAENFYAADVRATELLAFVEGLQVLLVLPQVVVHQEAEELERV